VDGLPRFFLSPFTL
jgi:hypothetical protein